jgi:hypothetical protein
MLETLEPRDILRVDAKHRMSTARQPPGRMFESVPRENSSVNANNSCGTISNDDA